MTTMTTEQMIGETIDIHYRQEAEAQRGLAARYLEHLNDGGDPANSPVTGYASPRLDPRFVRVAFRLWESARGDDPRPYTPGDGRMRYRVAAFMHAHLGEWVPYSTLRRLADGAPIESQGVFGLNYWQLHRETPYTVEKAKVGGKVQYRMVRRAES